MTEDATVTTLPVADSLRALLQFEKSRYLEGRKTEGGTAQGFRARIRAQYSRDPTKFEKLVLDALMEATTKTWQAQPRKRGTDLFSIAGIAIPEFLTRPSSEYVDGDDIEDDVESKFEKVHHRFATVNDLYEDATIKMRKAAQSSAAAESEMRVADEARRRAKGKTSALLCELADE
jgi:hypothetical protein